MTLSEKLYTLRRKSGLSQEQLAEQLQVSRQAISKWETGRAIPESDKLLAISRCFGVSLDYLLKDDAPCEGSAAQESPAASWQSVSRVSRLPGAVVCIGGVLVLLLWGLLVIFHPTASSRFSESSTIRLDGSGILLLCTTAIVTGGLLLLRSTKK